MPLVILLLGVQSPALARTAERQSEKAPATKKKTIRRLPQARQSESSGPMGAAIVDLALEDLSISDTEINDKRPVRVTFKVRNLGNVHCKEVPYRVFLSGTGRIPAPGLNQTRLASYEFTLDQGSFRNIPPGGQQIYDRPLTIDWSAGGDHWMEIVDFITARITVDSERPDPGTKSQNNFMSTGATARVYDRPDLEIVSFDKRTSGPSPLGSLFDVDYRVRNAGVVPSPATEYTVEFHTRLEAISEHVCRGAATEQRRRDSRKTLGSERVEGEGKRTYTIHSLQPGEEQRGSFRFRMHDLNDVPDRLRQDLQAALDYWLAESCWCAGYFRFSPVVKMEIEILKGEGSGRNNQASAKRANQVRGRSNSIEATEAAYRWDPQNRP
jgi:hypothetical protein